MVDLRINETFQMGAVANHTYRTRGRCRITELFSETSSNRTYRGESVYLFLEFTKFQSCIYDNTSPVDPDTNFINSPPIFVLTESAYVC